MAGVIAAAATGNQVALVLIERLGDGDGTGTTATGRLAHQCAGPIDRLPIREHGLAIRRLVVVGQSEPLGPLRTMAIAARAPTARAGVAAIAQRNSGRYCRPVRLATESEPAARCGAF